MCFTYELTKPLEAEVAILEQSIAPGGGAWIGDQLSSAMMCCKPVDVSLTGVGVPFKTMGDYVVYW